MRDAEESDSDSENSEDYDDVSSNEEEPLAPVKPWDVFEVRQTALEYFTVRFWLCFWDFENYF